MASGTRSAILDQLLKQSALSYDKLNPRLQAFAIKEIDRVRLELLDLLTQYAGSDGIIKRQRIMSLLQDLNKIEQSIRTNGMQAMTDVIKQSVELGASAGKEALIASIGADVIEAELVGEVFNRINAEAVRYVTNRFGDDGLVLSDRIWKLAKEQRTALEEVIRSGIIRGESVNTMVAQVRKVFNTETWKIRRLVVTEGNVAYRTGSAYVAQSSKFVKGLHMHHGWHDDPTHRCTELEHIDRYGLGMGIYLPNDPEVLNPHPNCTGYVTYELVDNVEEEITSARQ